MKRLLVLTPFALLALAAPASAGGGCHTGTPASLEAADTLEIHGTCFSPEAARVAVGATVTWFNASGMPHNIGGPAIDFADLPDGGKHTQKFTQAGLYTYACTFHVGMTGVVVVGDVDLAAAAPAANEPAPPAVSVQPVANPSTDDGGTSYVPWLVAGVAVLVAAGVVLTFARREGRVPLPAR